MNIGRGRESNQGLFLSGAVSPTFPAFLLRQTASCLLESSLDLVSSLSAAILTKSWLPNPPHLPKKLSRRSRTRSPVGYVWSPTNSRSCSSVSMCTVRSACNVFYVGGIRDRVSHVHNVARTLHCQWAESRGSKEPSTSTTSSKSKTPSRK